MYCRAEVVIKEPESTEVILDSVNHAFQAKLTIAKHNEELYRQGKMTFGQVLKSYDDVRQIGAHHWEYWHARAKFFLEAGLEKIELGQRKYMNGDKGSYDVLGSKEVFINTYET